MKKVLTLVLTISLVVALTVPAFAAPATTNANNGPGVAVVEATDVTVRIGGNGNSARLIVTINGVDYVTDQRPNNNANNTIEFEGFVIDVFIRGNSIMNVDVTPPEVNVPTIVGTRTETTVIINEVEAEAILERITGQGQNNGNYVDVIITETGIIIVDVFDVWSDGTETRCEERSYVDDFSAVVYEETHKVENGTFTDTIICGDTGYELGITVRGNDLQGYEIVEMPETPISNDFVDSGVVYFDNDGDDE